MSEKTATSLSKYSKMTAGIALGLFAGIVLITFFRQRKISSEPVDKSSALDGATKNIDKLAKEQSIPVTYSNVSGESKTIPVSIKDTNYTVLFEDSKKNNGYRVTAFLGERKIGALNSTYKDINKSLKSIMPLIMNDYKRLTFAVKK